MAHPKRRQSHTRQAKRRTHDVVKAPTLATCPNCGALHIYHTVCPSCEGERLMVKGEREMYLLPFHLIYY